MHRHRDVHRFVKELIRLRLRFDKASLEYDLTLTQFSTQAKIGSGTGSPCMSLIGGPNPIV